jgi:hypothetical protein
MQDQNKIQIDDLPFFARFLENQMRELPEVEAEDVVGGMKIGKPINTTGATTLKYPSDMEEGGAPSHPPIIPPMATHKYPSDGEDTHGSHPRPIVATRKYPSDFEDAAHH